MFFHREMREVKCTVSLSMNEMLFIRGPLYFLTSICDICQRCCSVYSKYLRLNFKNLSQVLVMLVDDL